MTHARNSTLSVGVEMTPQHSQQSQKQTHLLRKVPVVELSFQIRTALAFWHAMFWITVMFSRVGILSWESHPESLSPMGFWDYAVFGVSLAYYGSDAVYIWYHSYDKERIFFFHHLSAAVLFLSILLIPDGLILAYVYPLILAAEITNPMQQVWAMIGKVWSHEQRVLSGSYALFSSTFTLIFLFLRCWVGPYLLLRYWLSWSIYCNASSPFLATMMLSVPLSSASSWIEPIRCVLGGIIQFQLVALIIGGWVWAHGLLKGFLNYWQERLSLV